jgi:hypothetical protein
MKSDDRRAAPDQLASRGLVVAQLLFSTLEDDAVRCDLITLDEGRWGRQALEPGTPISVRFMIRSQLQQVALASLTSAWAAAMTEIRMALLDDGDRHYVVLTVHDGKVMLCVPPFD